MIEIWKDVVGYEGFYQVSNLGRVKRLGGTPRCNKDRILNPPVNARGYRVCVLTKNGEERRCWFVHQLVGRAFIDNPMNYPHLNHKDEDKFNNCVENLEWCDIAYNDAYGTRNQRCREAIRKSCGKKVGMYAQDGTLIRTFDTLLDVERELGYSRNTISKHCKDSKMSHNYIWRYINE